MKKLSVIILCIVVISLGFVVYYNRNSSISDTISLSLVRSRADRKDRIALARDTIEKYRLDKVTTNSGLEGLNQTDQYVEEINAVVTNSNVTESQISNYQTYVTPTDPSVKMLAQGKSSEQIYKEAVQWVWVEDSILNGVEEKWLSPSFFLTQTQSLSTNPVSGRIASDCESQAYTLVSLLRASGVSADNVRVVTGKVNFGGSIGGHAWVEMYDQNLQGWFALEATSGPGYDSESKQVVDSEGLPYTYFQKYQYPSLEIWTYFNDVYFWDNNRQQGVVAENWLNTDTLGQSSSDQLSYELPTSIQEFRINRAARLQNAVSGFDMKMLKQKVNEYQTSSRSLEGKTVEEVFGIIDALKIQYSTEIGLTTEKIQNQILYLLDIASYYVAAGVNPEQQLVLQEAFNTGIQEAYRIVENSSLSQSQKDELNALIASVDSYQSGITPAQKKLIQAKVLSQITQIEENISSGETKINRQEKQQELRDSLLNR